MYITNLKQLLSIAVLVTGIILIIYKASFAAKKKSFTKIFLFINSLIINDLALR